MKPITRNSVIVAGTAALFAIGIAQGDGDAELEQEANRLALNAALSGSTQAGARIIHEYADFAGSRANASNLVTGLQHGTAITLAVASGGALDAAPISFTPPLSGLDHAAIYISLALAKSHLANLGIAQPTPDQIKAALVGGTVESRGTMVRTAGLPGVLSLRARGMSWAVIARSQGIELDPVVVGIQSANHDLNALRWHYAGAEIARELPASNGL